jgi:hypothetical protein
MESFSKQCRVGVLLLGLLGSTGAGAQTPSGSLCQADEGVLFSCRLEGNNRTVSLCTTPKALPLESITYRYGTAKKVELTYTASRQNQNRFSASVSPASPRAEVNQIWFEVKGTRYVATECVGGDCAHDGGIIVLQGSKTVMTRACSKDHSNQPYFSSKVVDFESNLESSHSKTELIEFKDYNNRVDVLYPWKGER